MHLNFYPWIDAHAGWGLLGVCVLALSWRWRSRRAAAAAPLARMPGPAVALIVLLLGLVLFAALASQVLAPQPPAWLQAMDGWARQHQGALPAAGMRALVAVTDLGDVGVLSALAVVVGLVLWWRGRGVDAGWWLLAVAGNGLLVRWCKQLFGRSRPDTPYLTVHGYSFPSGHATSSMVIYGLLCVLVWNWSQRVERIGGLEARPTARRGLMLLLGLLILMIGASRIWLQVHYASDVLAGWLLGLCWLALFGLLAQPWQRAPAVRSMRRL